MPSCNLKASDDDKHYFLTPRMRAALQLLILMLYLRLLYRVGMWNPTFPPLFNSHVYTVTSHVGTSM